MNQNAFLEMSIQTIYVLLIEKMLVTSISLPIEMLEAASNYLKLKKIKKKLNIQFCSQNNKPVQCHGKLILTPTLLLNKTKKADLVIIPSIWRRSISLLNQYSEAILWIKEQHQKGSKLCVAGTGVSLVAEAGLLNYQAATTHWYFLDSFQKKYPLIDFKYHHFITFSNNIYCAGSVNSVADLMVHIIKLAFNETIANQIAQQFSYEIRKPYDQLLFNEQQVNNHEDEVIAFLQGWIKDNYYKPISCQTMSQLAELSQRTLSRRFKKATQQSPIQYLINIRINHSCELLKKTNLSIKEIASIVGLNNADYMNRLFKQKKKISPYKFRKIVHNKLFHIN